MPPAGWENTRAPLTWPGGKWVTWIQPRLSKNHETRWVFANLSPLFLCLENGIPWGKWPIDQDSSPHVLNPMLPRAKQYGWSHGPYTSWRNDEPSVNTYSTGGRKEPHRRSKCSLQVLIFTSKMTFAGRHSPRSRKTETDKNLSTKFPTAFTEITASRNMLLCSAGSVWWTGFKWTYAPHCTPRDTLSTLCHWYWRCWGLFHGMKIILGKKKKAVLCTWGPQDVWRQRKHQLMKDNLIVWIKWLWICRSRTLNTGT